MAGALERGQNLWMNRGIQKLIRPGTRVDDTDGQLEQSSDRQIVSFAELSSVSTCETDLGN